MNFLHWGERMQRKVSRWQTFKRFCKRNMTREWAAHFSYQVITFILSVCIVIVVADYAVNKTYAERTLKFVDGFTVTAHSGCLDTPENSMESLQAAVQSGVDIVEFDLRQSFDGTLVLSHDIVVSEASCVTLEEAFDYLQGKKVQINVDVKEVRTLSALHTMVYRYGLEDRVFLTGIGTGDVDNVRADCPGIDYYLNYSPSRVKIFFSDYQQKLLAVVQESGAVGINCNYKYACATLSNLLHDNGYKLSVWTVDSKKTMKRILVCSPDNITTKYPDRLQKIIDTWDA